MLLGFTGQRSGSRCTCPGSDSVPSRVPDVVRQLLRVSEASGGTSFLLSSGVTQHQPIRRLQRHEEYKQLQQETDQNTNRKHIKWSWAFMWCSAPLKGQFTTTAQVCPLACSASITSSTDTVLLWVESFTGVSRFKLRPPRVTLGKWANVQVSATSHLQLKRQRQQLLSVFQSVGVIR